jgi:hypothetical protein
VLYDPDDHGKVAFDSEAMQAANDDRGYRVIDGAALAAQASMPAVETAPAPGSEVDKLKELADLRDRGALTDAEFEAEKAKLLSL